MKQAVLTDAKIKKAKEKDKRYTLTDGQGLILEVMPTGSKFWRLLYRVDGKRKKITLGEYPAITLVDARKKAEELRQELARGNSPADIINPPHEMTFKEVAEDWFKRQEPNWAVNHAKTVRFRIERYLYPALQDLPMKNIKTSDLLAILKPIDDSGCSETAKRTRQIYGQIARYAMAMEICSADVSAPLVEVLSVPKVKHFPALTKPEDVKRLLLAMKVYNGSLIVKTALWFSIYTFARPGEVRHVEWTEIDLEKAVWNIPAQKMKKRKPHAVPLCRQCVNYLKNLYVLTGRGKWVFPTVNMNGRPMSNNTVNAALRSMGFSNKEMTAHGFRTLGSTLLNSLGYRPDAIEAALAHVQPGVRGIYNRGDYWDDRVTMMQAWADYLDGLAEK